MSVRAKARLLKLERKRNLPKERLKYRWGHRNNDYSKNDLFEPQQGGFVVVRWRGYRSPLLLS